MTRPAGEPSSQAFAILSVPEGQTEGGLLPVVSGDGEVTLEEEDGELLQVPVRGLHVWEAVTRVGLTLLNVRGDRGARLLISDGRLIVVAGAKGLRQRRRVPVGRDAALLVGHVRYEWLRAVGFGGRVSWSGGERLRVEISHLHGQTVRELYLDVGLPPIVDASAATRAIVSRAARSRLRRASDCTHAELIALERLAEQPLPAPSPARGFSRYELPGARAAGAQRPPG